MASPNRRRSRGNPPRGLRGRAGDAIRANGRSPGTTILGLYLGHDANVCVLRDGVVLGAVEAERTTRHHHQPGLQRSVLEGFLRHVGVRLEDVDVVALGGTNVFPSEDPFAEVEAPVRQAVDQALGGCGVMRGRFRGLGDRVGRAEIALGGRTLPFYLVDHHLSHCSLAFYTSPYPTAQAVSWDGGGDETWVCNVGFERGRVASVRYHPPRGKARLSIGSVWARLGALYPFGGPDPEGKIMGHAAYGTPREDLCAFVRQYMSRYRDYESAGTCSDLERRLRERVDFASLETPSIKDLSASLQRVTEEVMLELLRACASPSDAVVLSGGCAYNCVANGRLLAEFPRLFVSHCPHDGGLGLGAALFVWHQVLGHPFDGVAEFSPFRGFGCGDADLGVADAVVDDLLAERVVAWFDGRAENGKRALGHRSILLDPRLPGGRELLNHRVKHREWFRPFAPAVLAGESAWCEGPVPPSPYMSFSCRVSEAWRPRVPAILHVDGSCRPQIVSRNANPVFHRILERFRDATGVPMVLNTSFNVQEPIVDTPDHALATFERSSLDVLYVNGVVARRR